MREFGRFFSDVYATITGLPGGGYLPHPHSAAWQPPVDVFEGEDAIVVVVELPGVERDQISATVDRGILKIAGFRPKHVPKNARHVHQMEIPYGHFARSLRLPEGVDVERIEAEYSNGYLTIRLPRTAVL